ncbi:hypothetical protein SDC9_200518 [bioreactor metagenome]|uniref:TraB/GumN family protein n=1 Tax=bioreactor metagenome TaxID=1076179 RepID=A0A645IND2_9ZZZZ
MRLLESYPVWCECIKTATERREFERMVNGRNPGMARAIVREMAAGKQLFAAAGALHMIGPKGLPALLRKQGYEVTLMEFPTSPMP